MAANTVSRESYAYTGFEANFISIKFGSSIITYKTKKIVKRTASKINEINFVFGFKCAKTINRKYIHKVFLMKLLKLNFKVTQ